jgi:hypothetical protein
MNKEPNTPKEALTIQIGKEESQEEVKPSKNILYPGETALADLEAGEEFEGMIKGRVIDHEGKKCIEVVSVDGEAVSSGVEQDLEEMGPDEEATNEELDGKNEASTEDLKSKLSKMYESKENMYS